MLTRKEQRKNAASKISRNLAKKSRAIFMEIDFNNPELNNIHALSFIYLMRSIRKELAEEGLTLEEILNDPEATAMIKQKDFIENARTFSGYNNDQTKEVKKLAASEISKTLPHWSTESFEATAVIHPKLVGFFKGMCDQSFIHLINGIQSKLAKIDLTLEDILSEPEAVKQISQKAFVSKARAFLHMPAENSHSISSH